LARQNSSPWRSAPRPTPPKHLWIIRAAALLCLMAAPAWAQPADDGPILPDEISTQPIDLHGYKVQEMSLGQGRQAMLFTDHFELKFGQRQMSSEAAVVWVEPRVHPVDGSRYYELVLYLSGDASVIEPGGSITQDRVLYVSGVRTSGEVSRHYDTRTIADLAPSPIYQRGAAVRTRYENDPGWDPNAPGTEILRGRQMTSDNRNRPKPMIRYRLGKLEPSRTTEGQQVLVATDGVYLSRTGGRVEAPVLEILADSAVLFVAQSEDPNSIESGIPAEPVPGSPGTSTADADMRNRLQRAIRSVYLEGDVRLSLGNRYVRAARLFYDFELEQALILDAVLRAEIPERGIPLYVRADEIRQISATRFTAVHAKVTSDEFYTPHYHIGAERVIVDDRTVRDATGSQTGIVRGSIELFDTTFNIDDVPISYWPYARADVEQTEQLLRGISTGYDSERGVAVESRWSLYNLLGIVPPEGYDAQLRLDYFSERGPAVGIDADYETQDYLGLLRSYYIYDNGEDDLGPLRSFENEFDNPNRGRITWRHRHFLENDWEAIFEVSYIEDENFLETYERSEFFEGKDQETLVYLKRAKETDALTFLANWRILDYVDETEHLPEVAYRRIGDLWLDPIVLYHESRVGMVRRGLDDRRRFENRKYSNLGDSDLTFRTDIRQEAELPIKLGQLNIVPFASVRGTYWDSQPLDEGGLWRGLGMYGVRGSTAFTRVFPTAQNELLDVNGVRHVIKPDFAAWWGHTNTRSDQPYQFDEGIETVDDFAGVMFGVRQVWQTKRGGDPQRTVDWITLDLEAGFFNDPQDEEDGYANPLRPEDSRTQNYVAGEFAYRISDTTAFLYDFNIDVTSGEYDRHAAAIVIERLPRMAYVIGYQAAADIDYQAIGGGFNYRLTDKHIVAMRSYYDLGRNELGELALSYVRKLPRWYMAITFEFDEVFEDTSIQLSIWPEGIPEWTIGSRRFTGLGTSTGIRP
jgi:hypothetical protein